MKEIILNKTRLKEEELTDVLEKSRIVLRNDNDELVFARFGRVYMLPGGKIEEGETPVDAVKRELMDEPLVKVKHYLRDYELSDGTIVNRLVKTYYFSGYTSDDTIEYFNLTQNEKEDNLRGFFIDMEEGIELLEDYNKENPRAAYLALETLKVLEEYKNIRNLEE